MTRNFNVKEHSMKQIGRFIVGLAVLLASFPNPGLAQSTTTSADWSGYLVNGSEFTLATADWQEIAKGSSSASQTRSPSRVGLLSSE
jgi:hypothetical protein